MPALSPTMDKGNISSWLKKEGDKVATGDALADIETDKATQEFPWTEDDMFMAKMFHPAGSKDIAVGEPICILVENAKDVPAFKDFKAPAAAPVDDAAPQAAAPPPPPSPSPQPQVQTQAPPPAPSSSDAGRIFASPLARTTAAAAGIALNTLTGTGPNGRIINADVTEAAARPAAAVQKPAPAAKAPTPVAGAGASFVDIDVTQIRRVTAERLTLSKSTIPHYYLTVDCRVDKLQQVRKELNDAAKAGEYKLSVNDFVIKAAALAMRRVPSVNSSWQGTFIRQYINVDVSVAVNTDRGLITPIVFNAQAKGLAEISNNMKDLATRAKDNKLQLAEFSGGTFTVSNLGGFGIKQFAAVINPPQAAILAVGGIEERIVPRDANSDALTRAHFLTVTLSCDHRVVDGAIGANWMTAFKELIEEPNKLLL